MNVKETDGFILADWDSEHSMETIDELRKISNIIQALENLQAQCEGYEPFNHITEFARQSLLYSQKQLRRLIHQ